MPPAPGSDSRSRGRLVPDRPVRISRAGLRAVAALALLGALHSPHPSLAAPHVAESDDVPIAGAFVYPVGDELDYTRARSGESHGYYLSDPYMARRGSKSQ